MLLLSTSCKSIMFSCHYIIVAFDWLNVSINSPIYTTNGPSRVHCLSYFFFLSFSFLTNGKMNHTLSKTYSFFFDIVYSSYCWLCRCWCSYRSTTRFKSISRISKDAKSTKTFKILQRRFRPKDE